MWVLILLYLSSANVGVLQSGDTEIPQCASWDELLHKSFDTQERLETLVTRLS
jgi:hypothetical protein